MDTQREEEKERGREEGRRERKRKRDNIIGSATDIASVVSVSS